VSGTADWNRVTDVVQTALARALADRAAFLRETCEGDQELQAEVESLLEAHEQAGHLAERPAVQGLRSVRHAGVWSQFRGRSETEPFPGRAGTSSYLPSSTL
jgi:hypothetical protein